MEGKGELARGWVYRGGSRGCMPTWCQGRIVRVAAGTWGGGTPEARERGAASPPRGLGGDGRGRQTWLDHHGREARSWQARDRGRQPTGDADGGVARTHGTA